MNSSMQNSASRPNPSSVNPFARALAEARGNQGQSQTSVDNLSKRSSDMNSSDLAEQQRQQLEEQRRERLRQQLHRQVNPVEAKDVFSAQEQRVKKEIEELRHELKLLVQEVAAFNQDVEIAVMGNVAQPGTEGKYYFTFFQKLKQFIMLLRQQINSAHTWATTMSAKKKKKGKMGLEIGGQQYEQTTTIYDRMHHERSTVYSGS